MFLEKNLAAMKKNPNLSSLYRFLIDNEIEPYGSVEPANTGKPCLFVEFNGTKYPIHLTSDPEQEVPQFLALIPEDSHGVAIVFGMGLGYTPLGILKRHPDLRHIVVLEANPGVLMTALRHFDLTPLLESPKVVIFIPQTWSLQEFVNIVGVSVQVENTHFLHHLPSEKVDGEGFYKRAYEQIFSFVNQQNVAGNTYSLFGDLIILNRFEHLKILPFERLLNPLKDVLKGIPAVLVAAGPSLDKNVDHLKNVTDRAVIFAVDSAVPALLAHGIHPTFVTSIDFQPLTYEKISNVAKELSEIRPRLICTLWNTPSIFKNIPWKEVYRVLCAHPIDIWINEIVGGGPIFPGAQTVAHLNFQAAEFLGCSPLILVGQDLALSTAASHAKDTALMGDILKDPKRQGIYPVKGNVEDVVYTTRSYLSMKDFFEQMIKATDSFCINATEGGAFIEGTQVISLKDALNIYCKEDKSIEARLSQVSFDTPNPEHFISELKGLISDCKKVQKLIKKSSILSKEVTAYIKKAEVTGLSQLPNNIKKKLLDMEALNHRLDKEKRLWRFTEIMTINEFRQAERMKYAIDGKNYRDFLLGTLKRVDYVNKARGRANDILLEACKDTLAFIKGYGGCADRDFHAKVELLDSHDFIGKLMVILGDKSSPIKLSLEKSLLLRIKIAIVLRDSRKLKELLDEFKKNYNKELENKINEILERTATDFIVFAKQFLGENRNTSRSLILKGLSLIPENKRLQKSLHELFDLDIGALDVLPSNEEHEHILLNWCKDLIRFPQSFEFIPNEKLSKFAELAVPTMVEKSEYTMCKEVLKILEQLGIEIPQKLILPIYKVYLNTNELEKAYAVLKKMSDDTPDISGVWFELAEHFEKLARWKDAAIAYERSFLMDPSRIDLIGKIAYCYVQLNDLDGAKTVFERLKNRLRQKGGN